MRFRKPLRRGRLAFTRQLSYANVASTLALFLVLAGGSAYAATRLITGKQIAAGTITAKNIKAKSLLAKDFASKQLPAGARGASGATGATGATGPTGATGGAGATGAAGSAIAYGSVVINGAGVPGITSGVGFTGTTEPQSSIICVTPSFKDAAGNVIAPVVSPIGDLEVEQVNNQQCGGLGTGYEFQTLDPSNGQPVSSASGGGFSIAIP